MVGAGWETRAGGRGVWKFDVVGQFATRREKRKIQESVCRRVLDWLRTCLGRKDARLMRNSKGNIDLRGERPGHVPRRRIEIERER